jgi:regulator of replication initiation timing
VRAEERERYQMELKRIEEASIRLALENENLKKQLEEVQTVIFTGRQREAADEVAQDSRSGRTSSVKRRRR